jgi:hypothetical protein
VVSYGDNNVDISGSANTEPLGPNSYHYRCSMRCAGKALAGPAICRSRGDIAGNRSIRGRVINAKGLKQSSLARACEVRPAAPSPAQMPRFYFQREARATEKSMMDNLELGIFLAIVIAFVVCGGLVTRAPKKAPNIAR